MYTIGGHRPPKNSVRLPKNTDNFISDAIKVTMIVMTTRFSLLRILDFVKEMVEDLNYSPDQSPVPGIIFVPTLDLLCSPPQILII